MPLQSSKPMSLFALLCAKAPPHPLRVRALIQFNAHQLTIMRQEYNPASAAATAAAIASGSCQENDTASANATTAAMTFAARNLGSRAFRTHNSGAPYHLQISALLSGGGDGVGINNVLLFDYV